MVLYAGGGVAYSVNADGLASASKDLRDLVTEKADIRTATAWPSVDAVRSDKVARAVDEYNQAYRATWANLKDHLGALAETGEQAAKLYEQTDGKAASDASALSSYF